MLPLPSTGRFLFRFFSFLSRVSREKKMQKKRCDAFSKSEMLSEVHVLFFQNGQLCAEDRFWSRLCFLDTLKKIFCPCFRGRSRNLAINLFF
jgi:hypothetical protein